MGWVVELAVVEPMRALIVAALMLIFWAHAHAGDPAKPGSMSDRFLLTIAFEPNASRFNLALKNRSEETLSLRVEPRRFHGSIVVTPSGGQAVEYWDSAFRQLLLTSVWAVPVQSLRPQAEITWQLSVFELRSLHDTKLDSHILSAATVHAVLEEVAVVPANGSHISNNAKQTSKPIKIPVQSR